MTSPKVTVSIVSTDNLKQLIPCLESLPEEDWLEVLLVDNASSSPLEDKLRSRFPRLQVHRTDARLGFTATHNHNFKKARGEYVFILNDDTVVRPECVERLVEFLDTHPDVGIAGCKLVGPDGQIQFACARARPTPLTYCFEQLGLDRLFPGSRMFSRYFMSYWDHSDSREVEVLSGAAMMARRSLLETCGGFDEGYFIYYEDVDLSLRSIQQGYRNYYLAEAEVLHYGGQTSGRIRPEMKATEFRSAVHFFKKSGSLGSGGYFLVKIVSGLGSALRAGGFGILSLVFPARVENRRKFIDYMRLFAWHLGLIPLEIRPERNALA